MDIKLWAAAAIGVAAFAATRGNRPLWTAGALGIAVVLTIGAALVGLSLSAPLC